METEPIKVIADIIRIEMDLKNNQVLLYNQKFDIPSDDRLYICVGLSGFKNFGSRNKHVADPVTGALVSEQGINRQETYSIWAYSKGSVARTRNWEVPLALNSDLSQARQEVNSMKIGTIPTSMLDNSELEGTAILNRYSLTINALVAYQKTSKVPFFDTFQIPPVIVSNP